MTEQGSALFLNGAQVYLFQSNPAVVAPRGPREGIVIGEQRISALFPIRGTRTTSSAVSVLFVKKTVSKEGSIVFLL